MNDPNLLVCGRLFSPELLNHLQQLANQEPAPSGNQMAREACAALAWFSPDGRPALSSAKVALRKLQRRGLLELPKSKGRPHGRHKLRRSAQELPRLKDPPGRVDQLRGLHLHLLSGADDPLHATWNDLIIEPHPLGDALLVGAQLRYLIGSEHGWLGALGFGPAAFALGCRDQWIGWSTPARWAHLPEVVGLSRMLIRPQVRCRNLASKVLSLVASRLADDWEARYAVRPKLLETYVERSRFDGRSLRASNWRRLGSSGGRGRLGPKEPAKTPKDVWVYGLDPQARGQLQVEVPPPLSPCPLTQSLGQSDWCARELSYLDLGDQRRNQRARSILQARWNQPQASFYGSFEGWTPAKGAYGLIEHRSPDIGLQSLLASHQEQTQARTAVVEVRWAPVSIEAPAVGRKKGWPALSLWAVWVREPNPPAGVEPLEWMLLTDLPIDGAEAAWEKVQWYCRRWGIEEWHRALKSGCHVEQREFKTAEHLQRVLAFDLIVAWRVLACVKLGRELPQLPATVLYTPEELKVLVAAVKKGPKLRGVDSTIPA